jgi:hypothetical protein
LEYLARAIFLVASCVPVLCLYSRRNKDEMDRCVGRYALAVNALLLFRVEKRAFDKL